MILITDKEFGLYFVSIFELRNRMYEMRVVWVCMPGKGVVVWYAMWNVVWWL